MEIGKIDFTNKLAKIAIFVLLCEKVYNANGVSGKFSVPVMLILIISGFLYICFTQKIKINFIGILGLVIITCYGFSNESIRYGLFFLMVLIWTEIQPKDMHWFYYLMIVGGSLFTIIDILDGISRPSGFLLSPTLFSCFITLAIMYLLFEKEGGKLNYIFTLIGVILIYISESSTALICALGMIVYKIFININLSRKEKQQQLISKQKIHFLYGSIIICAIIFCIILFTNLNDILSIVQRGNREDSTKTRIYYIQIFISQLTHNIKMLLIGNGGGYTQSFINTTNILSAHMPLHQDILMLVCEYGLIGIIGIYHLYFKKLKINWIVWLVLILFSFHNLILCPQLMCLLIMTSNSLNSQYERNVKLWN